MPVVFGLHDLVGRAMLRDFLSNATSFQAHNEAGCLVEIGESEQPRGEEQGRRRDRPSPCTGCPFWRVLIGRMLVLLFEFLLLD